MAKRLTNEEFVAKATKVHGGIYSYEKAVYETKHSRIIVTCKKHGDYQVTATVHLLGSKCKKCTYEKAKGVKKSISNANQFSRLIAKANGEMFFKGAACSTCGGLDRYVCNNSCKHCAVVSRKKANKKWCGARRKAYKKNNIFSKEQKIQDWISKIYLAKQEMQAFFGVKLNIDHIIPINGKNICGLHVPWNMRITTEKFNKSKQAKIHYESGSCIENHVTVHESALPWNLRKEL